MRKVNMFDLTLLIEGPVAEYFEKHGMDAGKINEIKDLIDNEIQKDLASREKFFLNLMAQERSFEVEVRGRRIHGDIQFLLIQAGRFNIFQAIGYKMSVEDTDGIYSYKDWGLYKDYLPTTLVWWNPKSRESETTVKNYKYTF